MHPPLYRKDQGQSSFPILICNELAAEAWICVVSFTWFSLSHVFSVKAQTEMVKEWSRKKIKSILQHECETLCTRVRHEQHKCNTSATRTKRVQHECYMNDMRLTRVKNFDFDDDMNGNIFSHHYISSRILESLAGCVMELWASNFYWIFFPFGFLSILVI